MDLIKEWQQDKAKSKLEAKKVLYADALKKIQDVDAVTKPINDEIVANIDCLACANCCKTTVTTFSNEDINRASKFLGISKKAFISKYLISDLGEYTTIQTPCPFLMSDNKCSIYEARPMACQSFPHTHRKSFMSRRQSHENNYVVCPITYHLVKKLESLM
jgi:uncharacterized protein